MEAILPIGVSPDGKPEPTRGLDEVAYVDSWWNLVDKRVLDVRI